MGREPILFAHGVYEVILFYVDKDVDVRFEKNIKKDVVNWMFA